MLLAEGKWAKPASLPKSKALLEIGGGELDRKELPLSSFPIRGKRGLLFLEPSNQTQYGTGGVIFVDTNIYCNKFFTGIDYNMYHLLQF